MTGRSDENQVNVNENSLVVKSLKEMITYIITSSDTPLKSVPAGTRSEKIFLIDPSIGDDITIDMNGRWNCIRSRSTLVSKDDYQVVNYDSNTDALYQKRRVGRSYRKFTIERKEVYSVKWNDYQNNNEKKFRKVILILKDYDTERPYPIFLRYFLIDKNLPNEFQVKPHGNSKGSSPFYPTKNLS